jgi:hypothetical protein
MTNQNTGHPVFAPSETLHDLLPVSSFALWAVLLGLAPVLAFHWLLAA